MLRKLQIQKILQKMLNKTNLKKCKKIQQNTKYNTKIQNCNKNTTKYVKIQKQTI